MTKIEIIAGVFALAGMGLLIGSNYTSDLDKRKKIRIAGGCLAGLAVGGIVLTKLRIVK